MTAAALAAAMLLVGAASAQGAFVTEGSPYTVGDDPLSLNAADFNGDGRPDVATISFNAGSISVLLRQASGGFTQESGTPSLGQIGAIAAGDFNSDGRLDLAATEYNNSQVALLMRNGTSSGFNAPVRFPTGANPRAIAVGDYNGDGLADLAITNLGDDNATILRRVPGGSFSAEPAISVGDTPFGVVAADFDGNGRADLAVTNATPGTVTTLLRNGANTGFSAQPPIRVSASPVGIDAADFDRDGRPDLAVAANAGAVEIVRRNAGGGFTRDPAMPLAGAVNDVVAADFNGDSRPDLAASSYTGATADTFSALLNQFPAPPQEPTLPPPVAGKSVNVEPVSGTVKIKRPGRKRFVTLTDAAQIPVGSTIDTRRGRVAITAAQGKGKTASADFYQGLFKLTQTKRSKLTTLTLTERLSCPRGKASAAVKKKKKRRLWGDGKGRFRTKGKNSAATVLGTKWLVQDRCASTLTRVARGKVKVRDFAKRKTVTVRAGKRYIARAKRR